MATKWIQGFALIPLPWLAENIFGLPPLWPTLLLGGLALAILNAFLRPILKFLGALLPLITFALLAVILNGLIIYLADIYLTNLAISGLRAQVLVAILIGMVNAIF